MTLIGAILKKVQSQESINKKYSSPPPELEAIQQAKKKKKTPDKFAHVRGKVDTSAPALNFSRPLRRMRDAAPRSLTLYNENMRLVIAINKIQLSGGKVECHWERLPAGCPQYHRTRVDFLAAVQRQNRQLHKIITETGPRVTPAAALQRAWDVLRLDILRRAQAPFVLFPPVYHETIEDDAFRAPPGTKRPRVYLTLRVRRGAALGELPLELFTDVCPATCQLFLELLRGDHGFTYIGTAFFRKIPGLYWCGGDVALNNGFGCYLQRGRVVPQPPENYHFSHSMPGLLSMRVSRADEVCGVFNVTFKPLPQLDLQAVVFARVVRPSRTYTIIRSLGSALSTQPVVEIETARLSQTCSEH